MTKQILALSAALLAVSLATLTAQEVAEKAEIPAKHQKIFDRADTNADAKLSKEEADAAKPAVIGRRFVKMDVNSDGSVTIEEFSADFTKMEAAKAAKEAAGESSGE